MNSIGKFSNSAPKYKLAVFMMTVFIIYFPKGGVKIGSIPLTWGYVAIFIFSIMAIPRFLLNIGNISFSTCRLNVFFSLLPFQSIVIFSFIFNGVENFGFGISFIVSVIFLPFTFIILFHQYMEEMNLSYLFSMVKRGIIFVSLFGIFLFIYKLYTGSFLEIPFLTVNYDDLGELEGKHIDRGGIFKLISTYNNGNIYGICILMLLPLYEFLENSKIKRIIVKTSLVLTLSRTVWLGMIIYELLKLFYFSINSTSKHLLFIPRLFLELKIRKADFIAILFSFIGIILFCGAVFYMIFMIGQNASFLFDKNLGGRIDQLNVIDKLTFFPEKKFSQVSEIVYMSVLDSFGILGFLSFLLAMLSPVIYGFLRRVPFGGSLYKKSIMSGLIIYLVLAISDGAFLYIPVMAIYWFLISLLLLNNRYSDS
ncbi:hypothetical protein O0882_07260 [Janthinobacterium sp. SUN073]|uniref:hypothetical protein n=1 Tax=Janthinobacterium sp. SUN073 TaxID=3004102 RepID=UPI0025B0A335|nr:hypothetical protein [Janthinobacterium sp. SUN073]MDN2696110.1 hypothetical protein [Janthinobacterium sp. SUN073]